MKKYISMILLSTIVFTGCATWSGVKEDSSTAWEATKEGTSKAYKNTKEAIHDATAD
ncbi:hypothetical protein [Poseidonibacter lekithochrous]|uniref:hypothetical protein n=1 Tax=Poseidonibacter lekithochrous TaxID=1904463 RepID=UPI0013DB4854|nr:hypothetical protein [Poseidonibacter lekithochrous]